MVVLGVFYRERNIREHPIPTLPPQTSWKRTRSSCQLVIDFIDGSRFGEMVEYFVTQSLRDIASHNGIPKPPLLQQRQNMQTCRISIYQIQFQMADREDVHNKLRVRSIPKVFQILEVVHKGFILKILTLSEDYVLLDTEDRLQLRY